MNSKVKNNLKVAGVIVTVLFIAMCNAVNNRTCDPYDATGTMKAIEEENDKKALVAALTVKRSLRNPDSLVLEKVIMTEKAVCVTYRGQNGFGGMNRAQAVVALDSTYAYSSEEPEFHKAWNRDCAGTGKDLTRYAQWNIEYADRALR